MKQFDVVQLPKPQRSVFDLSHENKLTFKIGDLVPILCEEVVPGDKFNISTESLIRAMPLVGPTMHRCNVDIQFFFVPNRIVNAYWEDFITGGYNGNASNSVATPIIKDTSDNMISSGLFVKNTLADYLGVPVERFTEAGFTLNDCPPINLMPFRAYQRIYNDYYRDENTMPPIAQSTDNATYSIDTGDHQLIIRRRGYEKDYFTSALGSAQRGQPVSLPLGEVKGRPIFSVSPTQHTGTSQENLLYTEGSVDGGALEGGYSTTRQPLYISGGLNVGATLVNDLRKAYAIQRWFEKSMRVGYRYAEQIQGIFGIKYSDARLQRAEYLGGTRNPLIFSEVLQTAQPTTVSSLPQGNMAGHGIGGGFQKSIHKFVEEHGYIIGIMSAVPRTCYYQGLPKIFSKFDRFDYLTPDFAHIGEVPVLNQELYVGQNATLNKETWGYQPRYMEYRQRHDRASAGFMEDLYTWAMVRKFEQPPTLSTEFVEVNNDSTKVAFAVTNGVQLVAQIYFHIKASRPLPYFGTPMP